MFLNKQAWELFKVLIPDFRDLFHSKSSDFIGFRPFQTSFVKFPVVIMSKIRHK